MRKAVTFVMSSSGTDCIAVQPRPLMLFMLLVLPALSARVDFERAGAHLREKTMAPNPGISGSSGARMMRATPETCRSVTLGTILVPVASSRAISMLEWPDSLKLICIPKRQEWS